MFKKANSLLFVASMFFFLASLSACGGSDTSSDIKKVKNLTLFVHGFDKDGYKTSGTFGNNHPDEALEKFQALGEHYPVTEDTIVINITKSTTYYGDTPPNYYSKQDIQDLSTITAQWDGGIPRYALIIAKYAKHLMKQEKVNRINIVSGSMGSLVTRWMIEKDVEGLASNKKKPSGTALKV